MVFHGAIVGDGCRLGAGSIVHTGAWLPDRTRVGMRQFAVPGPDGAAVVTSDLDAVRASARSTRIAERALLAGQRPVLATAGIDDPAENVQLGAGLAVLRG
jgi:carbonic anhydrase/acetyltransferase-like protein (isoleucine patch superfamily)